MVANVSFTFAMMSAYTLSVSVSVSDPEFESRPSFCNKGWRVKDDLNDEMERRFCSNFRKTGFLTGSSLSKQLSVANSDVNADDSLNGEG